MKEYAHLQAKICRSRDAHGIKYSCTDASPSLHYSDKSCPPTFIQAPPPSRTLSIASLFWTASPSPKCRSKYARAAVQLEAIQHNTWIRRVAASLYLVNFELIFNFSLLKNLSLSSEEPSLKCRRGCHILLSSLLRTGIVCSLNFTQFLVLIHGELIEKNIYF